MSAFQECLRESALRQVRAEEATVRRMLGEWVSELEPALARRASDGALVGLTLADIPLGETAPIVVRA
jgi:hypothetical protein